MCYNKKQIFTIFGTEERGQVKNNKIAQLDQKYKNTTIDILDQISNNTMTI